MILLSDGGYQLNYFRPIKEHDVGGVGFPHFFSCFISFVVRSHVAFFILDL